MPTKYLTDEVGYMDRLAGAAAVLFDELGLYHYAEICRSDVTRGVHATIDGDHPVETGQSWRTMMAPITWLLGAFGDEQPLTQAGYLSLAEVWAERGGPRGAPPQPQRSSGSLSSVPHRMAGAGRQHRRQLRRPR